MFVLALRKASLLNGDMNIHPTLNIISPSLVPDSLCPRLLKVSPPYALLRFSSPYVLRHVNIISELHLLSLLSFKCTILATVMECAVSYHHFVMAPPSMT